MSELTTKKETLPASLMSDLLSGEGVDYDTSELQIPFVRVIQALSPQIKKNDSAFIKGASQGDAFNTVTGDYWNGEEGFEVVPCLQQTKYLEFIPRDQGGGGFVGELSADDPNIARATRTGGKEILPNGNELVKSDQHYCMLIGSDGLYQPVIVDMKSTQLSVSRRWKTQIAMLKVKDAQGVLKTPALFGTVWRLTTVEQSNDMGTWYNWSVEKVKMIDDEALLQEAINFRKSIQKGEAKAVVEDHDDKEEAPF
jgi:hypothetical protein